VATKIADIDKERIVGVLENSHPDPSSMGYGSLTRTVHGRDHFFMKILGRSYKVKGTADAPVSPEMCGEMWNRLDELLPRSFDRAVHGGSGIGLFCLWFAGRSRKVTGIEPSGDADRSARENAVIAGQGNVEFVRGKPEDLLPGSDPPDVLMLSPSRGTLEPSLIRWMTTDRPKRIFLRSSDLRLARDVHALSGAGYEIVSVDAFDFMPHTPRVDLLVTLS
jgi:23S rRNA (uracil1939-C5)-methyltransferase